MPIFFQHKISETTKLGIWKIEETEDFFKERVPQHRDVTHPHKRLQHLAGRFLLRYLFPDFPHELIQIADTRKPYLPDEQYHFSISHCGDYAAAIVSSNKRVGIDIELVTPRIGRVAEKFLTSSEEKFFNEPYLRFLKQWDLDQKVRLEFLTLAWSSKEALFKWYGAGELDFKTHLQLTGDIVLLDEEWIELPFLFAKGAHLRLKVRAKLFPTLVLAYHYS